MAEKNISVVIPVYNAANTLKSCLENLFKNNYKNYEVIVVNDDSTDNSLDIAKTYHCNIVTFPERRGPAFARDRGVLKASGEIVAFLDADCIVPDDWLAEINNRLKEDMLGIGGRYLFPKEIGDISLLFMAYWDLKNILYERPFPLVSFSGGNCAFWKAAFTRERKKYELLYSSRRVGGDDTIMCHELRKFGKLIYDPGLAVTHNKKSGLRHLLKETVNLGYSGAAVSRLCGGSLLKEPHRLYKFILYLLSLTLFLTIIYHPVSVVYLMPLYVTIQLPIIFLIRKHLSRRILSLSLPVVIFISDLLHLTGHLKMLHGIALKAAGSGLWHTKLLLNVISPSALSRIFFFVTGQCNAKCYFCFNREYRQRDEDKDLSLNEIKDISARAGFLPWLTITGGEPFLRKDIYEICKLFYTNCGTRIISIATNGSCHSHIADTTERLLIDCDGLYLTIIVALDDIGEAHDVIKGIDGSYQKSLDTLASLKILRARFPRLKLGINTTVIKENAGRIEKILDYFANNLNCDRYCLNLLKTSPCASKASDLISVQRYLGLVKKRMFPLRAPGPFTLVKQRFSYAALEYFCNKSQEESRLKKGLGRCLAAQKFFVINNSGKVYACELLSEQLGDLRRERYDFRRLKNSPKIREARAKITRTNCYCQWPCAIATNGYFNIWWYPSIISHTIYSLFRSYRLSA